MSIALYCSTNFGHFAKGLLAKANEINAEQGKITDYSIDNLGDVYEAIHVVQEDLGLTGVAADEAATTFTGSMGAMKAAATNFLAALTTDGDVQGTLSQLMMYKVHYLL